jgi:hypothetical protein
MLHNNYFMFIFVVMKILMTIKGEVGLEVSITECTEYDYSKSNNLSKDYVLEELGNYKLKICSSPEIIIGSENHDDDGVSILYICGGYEKNKTMTKRFPNKKERDSYYKNISKLLGKFNERFNNV